MQIDPDSAPLDAEARSPLGRFKATVDTVLGWTLVVLMGAAVLNVLWQVFTRFVLSDPSAFTDELARYLLIWVGLLGSAYAGGKRMHLAIDLLPRKLTGRAEHALGAFIEVCVFAFSLFVLVVGGLRLVSLTLLLGQTSAALQLPLGYVYFVLPLTGVLLMFYAGLFFSEHVRQFFGRRPLLIEFRETPAEAFSDSVEEVKQKRGGTHASGAAPRASTADADSHPTERL